MASHLTSYFKSKSTLSQLASSTLTVLKTSRKQQCQTKGTLKSFLRGDDRDISTQVKSLKDKINLRLKQTQRKNKENHCHNTLLNYKQKGETSARVSCIRKMLFTSEHSQQKTRIKLSPNQQKKKERKRLQTQFEQRQKKAILLKRERSALLLKEKQEKELSACTFKPKLNRFRFY